MFVRQWVIRYNNTRAFNAEDNKTDEKMRIRVSFFVTQQDFKKVSKKMFLPLEIQHILQMA